MVKYKIYKDEASIVIDVAKGKIDDDGTSILKREFINLFSWVHVSHKAENNRYMLLKIDSGGTKRITIK